MKRIILSFGFFFTLVSGYGQQPGVYSELLGMTQFGGLYGEGVVFKVNSTGSNFQILKNLDTLTGNYPMGSLVMLDSAVFGLTNRGGNSDDGTLFSIDTGNSNSFSTLLNFNTLSGANPEGTLVQVGDELFGLSVFYPRKLFSYRPSDSTFTIKKDSLYTNRGGLTSINDTIYGTDFMYIPSSDNFIILPISWSGKPVKRGSFLYGFDFRNFGFGQSDISIKRFDLTTQLESSLYQWPANSVNNHNNPEKYITLINNKIYGIVNDDMLSELFVYDLLNDQYQTLHLFNNCSTGCDQEASIILDNSFLYGMTRSGGMNNSGVIFKIDTLGNNYQTIFDFRDTLGASPIGNLTVNHKPCSVNNLKSITQTSCTSSNNGQIAIQNINADVPGPYTFSIDGGHTFYTDSTFQNLSVGNYYIQVRDTYTGCLSVIDTVIISSIPDTTAPTLTCPPNVSTVNAPTSCNTLAFLGFPTATDNCTISAPNYIPNAGAVPIFNLGAASAGQFPIGTTTVTYTGIDDSGNTGTCTFSVTVDDIENPIFNNCPDSIVSCAAMQISWTPPTPSDNCPNYSVTTTHDPGDIFPLGSTTVDYLVTDASNNTAGCSFVITVNPAPLWYPDWDGDGYGNNFASFLLCTQPNGYVNNNLDCNDNDSTINPGATEICNGLDDNCDGQIDEGVSMNYWVDNDSDGFGDASGTMLTACAAPIGYVLNNSDCDDTDSAVNPNATEICNYIDDNCNGQIDENVVCAKPANIVATDVTSTSTILRWGPSCGATKYWVRYKPLGNVPYTYRLIKVVMEDSLVLNELSFNTLYRAQVRAFCPSAGWTNYTSVNFNTLSTPACSAPYVTGLSATDTTINVQWVAIPNVVRQFIRWRERGVGASWQKAAIPVSKNSYTIQGLNPNTEYEYGLRSRCAAGWLSWSVSNRAFTLLPPPIPRSIQSEVSQLFLRISPNPSRGAFSIQTNMLGNKSYKLYSLQGRLLAEWKNLDEQFQIELDNIPKGVYFLKVQNREGERIEERLIKI